MKVFFSNGSALRVVTLCVLFGHGIGGRLPTSSVPRAGKSAAARMIAGGPNFHLGNAIDAAARNTDYSKAAAVLKQRSDVPADVAALLDTNSSASLDEASLTKARNFLNALVESSFGELDEKLIAAKEFELHSSGMKDQSMADMARLSSEVSDDGSKITQANSCLSDIEKEMDGVRDQQLEEQSRYMDDHGRLAVDLNVKQNDLAVFTFLVNTVNTMCVEQAGLLQVARGNSSHESIQVCSASEGPSLHFNQPSVQAKFNKLLAKSTNGLLRNALAIMSEHVRPMSFLQVHQPMDSPVPVLKGADKEMTELKCGPIRDCGQLYEEISIEWGGYKDQVDELKAEMDDADAEWKKLSDTVAAQLDSLVSASDECTRLLGEGTGAKNSDQQLLTEKDDDNRQLNKQHEETMTRFHEEIQYVFDHMCSFITVRNEVMAQSQTCKPVDIYDCAVSSWTPESCSAACDDSCPLKSASQSSCGGRQRLTRQIVQEPNTCGYACPALSSSRKCNQVKCPVDCVMSEWSGFDKCSKECEGGIQIQTRDVQTKPKHGGAGCKVVSKARSCNTGSCDRDCYLSWWRAWGPCSVACGGGNQQRRKEVWLEQRGQGKCPTEDSPRRLGNQPCNVQKCVGDEICIGEQDLVIAVDGSASVLTAHWNLVKNFTGELLARYESHYHGKDTMKVGLIEFGNGEIDANDIVTKANLIMALTSDLAALKAAASGMAPGLKLTNMAQAFLLAGAELGRNLRTSAQSAVLMISDGMPLEGRAATEKAKELTDRGIMKFMVAISPSEESESFITMRTLASQPWDTNTVRVPDWDALADGGGPFVQMAITKFCPDSMSPSLIDATAKQTGWRLVYEEGYCGGLGRTLSYNTKEPQRCYELATEKGATGYSMGRRYRRGKCCVEKLQFTCAEYKQWAEEPDNPQCSSSWGGGFHKSRYYDWYAIQPADCF